jgi:hypothetical protein
MGRKFEPLFTAIRPEASNPGVGGGHQQTTILQPPKARYKICTTVELTSFSSPGFIPSGNKHLDIPAVSACSEKGLAVSLPRD